MSITVIDPFSVVGNSLLRDDKLSDAFAIDVTEHLHTLLASNTIRGYEYVNNWSGVSTKNRPALLEIQGELLQQQSKYLIRLNLYYYRTNRLFGPSVLEVIFKDLIYGENDRKIFADAINEWFFAYCQILQDSYKIYQRLHETNRDPSQKNFDLFLKSMYDFGNTVKEYFRSNKQFSSSPQPDFFINPEEVYIDELVLIVASYIYQLNKEFDELKIEQLKGVINFDDQIEVLNKTYDLSEFWGEISPSRDAIEQMKAAAVGLKQLYELTGDNIQAAEMKGRIKALDSFLNMIDSRS
jgi:hypothetical protein